MKKYIFEVTETLFVGYGISADQIDIESKNIEAIYIWSIDRIERGL
jgi:hypothetical protein